MKLRISSLVLASTFALLPACDVEATDPMTVRSGTTTESGYAWVVELEGETRDVLTLELGRAGRVVLVAAEGTPLAVAWTDGETLQAYDPTTLVDADPQTCDATCPDLDSVTAEILDIALDDAIPHPTTDAPQWRTGPLQSSVQKKYDQVFSGVAQKMG